MVSSASSHFQRRVPADAVAAALSVVGILVTAIFLLTIIQRVSLGRSMRSGQKLPDLT